MDTDGQETAVELEEEEAPQDDAESSERCGFHRTKSICVLNPVAFCNGEILLNNHDI